MTESEHTDRANRKSCCIGCEVGHSAVLGVDGSLKGKYWTGSLEVGAGILTLFQMPTAVCTLILDIYKNGIQYLSHSGGSNDYDICT